MSLIPRRELIVTRENGGGYFEGEWVSGPNNSFTINASVQATNAQTLQTLTEGQRVGETYTLYTDMELMLKDQVTLNDKEFLVIKVAHWQHFKATSHYQAVITKSLKDEYQRNL